jgi:hypothetical protein
LTAPSTWYEAVADPQRNPAGKWRGELPASEILDSFGVIALPKPGIESAADAAPSKRTRARLEILAVMNSAFCKVAAPPSSSPRILMIKTFK